MIFKNKYTGHRYSMYSLMDVELDEYQYGQLENIEIGGQKLRQFLTNLSTKLVEKNIITHKELLDLIGCKDTYIEIKEE